MEYLYTEEMGEISGIDGSRESDSIQAKRHANELRAILQGDKE